ncbi:DUF3256 family protein [Phocaeicola sp.]|uniref:DUF3256 family protein n=1 Tax=Phocaeicola sp. TaxID=2773926 RepID=UPI003868A68E
MKKILLILGMCLCVLTTQAQDIKSLFITMPDSLSLLLTKVNREDFGDFLASNMKAEVKNRFGKPSEMTKLTADYLKIKMTSVSEVEMKLLPLNDSTKILCVVHTYMAPTSDSHISFYDTSWRKLSDEAFLTLPEEDSFYRNDLSEIQTDSVRNLRMRTDMYMLKAELSEDTNSLRFVYTTPDYLDKETAKELAPYLREMPLLYEWKEGKFVLSKKDSSISEK